MVTAFKLRLLSADTMAPERTLHTIGRGDGVAKVAKETVLVAKLPCIVYPNCHDFWFSASQPVLIIWVRVRVPLSP